MPPITMIYLLHSFKQWVAHCFQTLRQSGLMIGLLLMVSTSLVAKAQSLEIIELRHRPAQEVVPIISPLLPSGSTISGHGFSLFIRAPQPALADVKRLIANLDVQQKRLLISVQQGGALESDSQSLSTQSRINQQGGQINLRGNSRTLSTKQGIVQQVQVMDGGTAFIANVSTRLISRPQLALTQRGTYYSDASLTQQASTGFYVRPTVRGNTVMLDIATQRENLEPNSQISQQQAYTTISGRIGEWIELGGLDESATHTQDSILSTVSSSRAGSSSVRVKVDIN